MSGRPDRLVFGAVAEAYERFRPEYPADLVDAVLDYAGRPVRTALEVGAGTGKATRVFAARDVAVTAVEPDPAMADVLRRTVHGLPVTVVVSTFEGTDAAGPVDVVYSAAAWHWTDPATRWTRAASLLEPRGVLALFGCPAGPADPDVAAALVAVERDVLGGDDARGTAPWSPDDLRTSTLFTDATTIELPRTTTASADDYVGLLGTQSPYLVLDEDDRAEALRRVRAVLPERFTVDTTVRLDLARRR